MRKGATACECLCANAPPRLDWLALKELTPTPLSCSSASAAAPSHVRPSRLMAASTRASLAMHSSLVPSRSTMSETDGPVASVDGPTACLFRMISCLPE